MNEAQFVDKMKKIKLFSSDIDGVMTDAGMYYSETGDELKKFNTRDGGGLMLLQLAGVKTVLITSETVDLVKRRAKKLKVDYLFQVTGDKWFTMEKLIRELGLQPENVSHIGDDINDITLMEKVGLRFAVADAVDDVKSRVDIVLTKKGGEGAVREAAELILRKTGKYDQALEKYFEFKRNVRS